MDDANTTICQSCSEVPPADMRHDCRFCSMPLCIECHDERHECPMCADCTQPVYWETSESTVIVAHQHTVMGHWCEDDCHSYSELLCEACRLDMPTYARHMARDRRRLEAQP